MDFTVLNGLREKLDQIDSQICYLLDERMRIVEEVAYLKLINNLPLFHAEREDEIIKKIKKKVEHPVLKENIDEIFSNIIHQSKIAQKFSQSKKFPFHRIGIIGNELLGLAICKIIRFKDPSIVVSILVEEGSDSSNNKNWFTDTYTSLLDMMLHTECLILALNAKNIILNAQAIFDLMTHLTEKLIVIDISSLKEEVIQILTDLSNDKVEFIASHPLMKHKIYENENKFHFIDSVQCPWFVVPHPNNTNKALNYFEEIIQFIGGDPVFLQINNPEKEIIYDNLDYWISKNS